MPIKTECSCKWDGSRVLSLCKAHHPRHFDLIMQQAIRCHEPNAELNQTWASADQGFIDQWGQFYKRKEAAKLAVQNGQCDPSLLNTELFSEDLY